MDIVELSKEHSTHKSDGWKSLGTKLRENPKPEYPRPEPKEANDEVERAKAEFLRGKR